MSPVSHLPSEDLALVNRPALTALVILILCAGMVGGAHLFHRTQARELQNARQERAQAAQLARRTTAEEEEIHRYLAPYRELTSSGITGQEDRIGLVERIEQIRQSYRLFPIQIEIEPRFALPIAGLNEEGPPRPAANDQTESGSGPQLLATPVSLSLSLLHEEDLVHLLDRLHSLPGLFVTERCTIELAPVAIAAADRVLPENLQANCRLLWLSLDERRAERHDQ